MSNEFRSPNEQATADSFLARLVFDHSTRCWLWTGAKKDTGYGAMKIKGVLVIAHRMAYELFCGPIPSGMFVCHKCDVRSCCNPVHLFLGTNADNMQDKKQKGRAHRLRGEANARSKLTNQDIDEIRRRHSEGKESSSELAREFEVSTAHIRKIVSYKRWICR